MERSVLHQVPGTILFGLGHRQVPRIELIYGERDWMDCRHGNRVATASVEEVALPCVAVQLVEEAGRGCWRI